MPPRPRPHWRTELNTPEIGAIAEDLVGVALMAAAGGTGSVGRPRIDKGIDLYLRGLESMVILPFQVKASIVVTNDGSVTHFVPVEDLRMLSKGFVTFVHIPAPYDQLYGRIFLVPDDEFRQRCSVVAHHGVRCYRFTAQFAGAVDPDWAHCAVELDRLASWITAVPGWSGSEPRASLTPQPIRKAESKDIGAIGSLWAQAELERVATGELVLVEDRLRVDTVTFFVHDLRTERYAGIHMRTAVITREGRIHFEVKRPHFFADPDLWVVLVLLTPEHRIDQDFVLLIPSADIAGLGFSETVTVDPLTKRFRKYQIPARDFAQAFLDKAFSGAVQRVRDVTNRGLLWAG